MRWRVDFLVAISLVMRWFGGKMTLNRMWIWDAPLAFDDYAKGYPGIRDLTKRQCGIRENVDGMRDLTKIQCGSRETLTGYGI